MSSKKKKIIITISFSFSIRYIVRTGLLNKLRAFCEPVIVITWNQSDLINELRENGYEVFLLEPNPNSPIYDNIRRKIDYWFIHYKLKSPSPKIQENLIEYYTKSSTIKKLSLWYNLCLLKLPFYKNKLFKNEAELVSNQEQYIKSAELLNSIQPDAVFTLTPFHKQEDMFLRAAKNKGIKMITSILSFDNITKRGWIPFAYDFYMVWNKYNQEELFRIYEFTNNENVHITGAPQFDFYKDQNYILEKEEWQEIVGIPKGFNGKVILYSGGSPLLFPNETDYIKIIDSAINQSIIPKDTIVLFRCHPGDRVERWKSILGKSKNVFFDSSWSGKEVLGQANITKHDIAKLCSTLHFTDVHINLCSTMTVDGSYFKKPQIGPAFELLGEKASRVIKNIYFQEHFLPIIKTNGIALATSETKFLDLINKALQNDKAMIADSEKIVTEIITYLDGQSTDRVVNCIREQLTS